MEGSSALSRGSSLVPTSEAPGEGRQEVADGERYSTLFQLKQYPPEATAVLDRCPYLVAPPGSTSSTPATPASSSSSVGIDGAM